MKKRNRARGRKGGTGTGTGVGVRARGRGHGRGRRTRRPSPGRRTARGRRSCRRRWREAYAGIEARDGGPFRTVIVKRRRDRRARAQPRGGQSGPHLPRRDGGHPGRVQEPGHL